MTRTILIHGAIHLLWPSMTRSARIRYECSGKVEIFTKIMAHSSHHHRNLYFILYFYIVYFITKYSILIICISYILMNFTTIKDIQIYKYFAKEYMYYGTSEHDAFHCSFFVLFCFCEWVWNQQKSNFPCGTDVFKNRGDPLAMC